MTAQTPPNLREKWLSYWRRRGTFFLVAGIVFTIAILIAVFWPATYKSSATILIEQQEIPQDLVRSTITSFADQRIQMIKQRVMTTKNLIGLIDRYHLYPDIRDRKPREELLKTMQDDIGMNMISADVVDPRSGRPTQATIAFAVSYESHSPDLALKVANDLTSLYLNENLTTRQEMSQQTSEFLGEEAKREDAHIRELDQKLSDFKEKHRNELPELTQLNVELEQRTDLDMHDSENRITALDSQRVLLEAQLAQLHPNTTVFSDTGERIYGTEDRLKDLKSKLAAYKARYGPNHPDVLRTQREVDGLEKEVAAQDSTTDRLRQLSEARAELAADQQKYSPTHPDVIRLQHLIASLEKQVQADADAGAQTTAQEHPDNPVYIQVKGQLDALTADRNAEIKKRDQLQAKLEDYQRRMAQSPDVERQYREMARDLDTAQLKYQEIVSKQTEAHVAQDLESERKGERFTLIEPPQPPERPVSPNAPMIIVAGLVLAVALGFGSIVAREAFDSSVRGPADIRALLQVPALACIPPIMTDEDRARRKRFRFVFGFSSAVTVIVAVVCVHLFVRPLDVLWLVLWRRFGV